jgi:hypothetical protein
MRSTALMLAGMIVWVLHFGGVYLIASLLALLPGAGPQAALWAGGGWTLACVLADLAVLRVLLARHAREGRDPVGDWMNSAGILLAGISLIAVLWQGLPLLWV